MYEKGFPIMAAAGVPGTVWMITDTIGSEDYNGQPQLTETQLLELQAAGWEIDSHTTSHIDLSKLSLEDAIADMEASKAALESIGFICKTLAYPWGNYTPEVAAAGSEIYEWQRSAYKNPGYNVLYKQDYPDRLPTIGALSPRNNEEAFSAIDRAVETDSVVILFWHSVAANGQVGGGSVANLHDIVDHIQKTGIEPITMSEIPRTPRTTYVWDGEGATELASEAANWYRDENGIITNDVAPVDGSIVVWDHTSAKNCTWDLDALDVTVHTWLMSYGYTGTVTQGDADIGVGSGGALILDGTIFGNPMQTMHIDGNLYVAHGTYTASRDKAVHLSMTGANNCMAGEFYAGSLRMSGKYVLDNALNVVSGGDALIDGDVDVRLSLNIFAPDKLYISGYVHGPGTLVAHISRDAALDIGDGVIDVPLVIELRDNAAGSRTVTMLDDISARGIIVRSSHATNTVTLDIAGRALITDSVAVGARGAIIGGNGTIITSAWDSSAGTWTPEESTVVLRDGGTVKLAPGQSFNRLEIASEDGRTASWTMTATGAQAPIVTGLKSGSYLWYLDGVEQGEVKAGKDGTIALSYQSTGLHTLEVQPTSMTAAMDGLAAAIGIIVALAVLGGVLGMLGKAFGRLKF